MAKLKHIAIATQDPDKTAKFYIEVFGLREIAKINSPGALGYHLTDGDINLAILKFKNDQTAGVPEGKELRDCTISASRSTSWPISISAWPPRERRFATISTMRWVWEKGCRRMSTPKLNTALPTA
jgi:hypothetical protein